MPVRSKRLLGLNLEFRIQVLQSLEIHGRRQRVSIRFIGRFGCGAGERCRQLPLSESYHFLSAPFIARSIDGHEGWLPFLEPPEHSSASPLRLVQIGVARLGLGC
jgi:hypothetical protein